MKKTPLFIADFESSYEVLLTEKICHVKILDSVMVVL